MHGFRKKPELARQLLDAGIDLSMRAEHIERYPDIPRERIHTETDAPDTSLPDIKLIGPYYLHSIVQPYFFIGVYLP